MSRSSTTHTFFKDLQQLYRTIEASTDGQAAIIGIDEMSVKVLLRPKSGCNAHAEFIFSIKCSEAYPRCCPNVLFHSPIFHPNIDTVNGGICVSLLSDWQGCHSLLDIVKAILYLIDHPNFSSANNSYATLSDPKHLPTKTARLLAGLPVNGIRFTPNAVWCEWARANGCLPTCEEEVEEPDAETQAEALAEAQIDAEEEDVPKQKNEEKQEVEVEIDVEEKNDKEKEEEGAEVKEKRDEVNYQKHATRYSGFADAYADASDSDDDGDVGHDCNALTDKSFKTEISDGLSATASESVPSFAKIRYDNAFENSNSFSSQFRPTYEYVNIESQRIQIWQPRVNGKPDIGSTFYFVEILGAAEHQKELGVLYSTLLTGNVLRDDQILPESRQTSTVCPWHPFEYVPYYYYRPSSYSSTMCLDQLFKTDVITMRTLTSDFCPWSLMDGKGCNDLLGGIFFEGDRHGANFDLFVDADSDSDGESAGIGHIFDSSFSDNGSVVQDNGRLTAVDVSESQTWSEDSHNADSYDSQAELSTSQGECDFANEPDNRSVRLPSSGSVSTYVLEYIWNHGSMLNCVNCNYHFNELEGLINVQLTPQWRWLFRQTRWPIRFAPQQRVDLSMTGICIPPWRVSTGRLMSDVCHFCTRNHQMNNLALLDPMALSPLSPVLNLMRHSTEPRPHLTGVLWMTLVDALSPFYRVPVPATERRRANEGVGEEVGVEGGDKADYPRPACLRFFTVTAFLINWVAWLSRIEIYTTLGMSRLPPVVVSAPVAACILQPFSLGCGQVPLLDSWPLWMLRRFLTFSLRLSQFHLPLSQSTQYQHHRLQFLFPFSDIGDI